MASTYERLDDELLAADDDDIISSASEDAESIEQGQGRLELRSEVTNQRSRDVTTAQLVNESWPRKIGIFHLVWGIIVLIFGLIQVIVVPIVEDRSSTYWKPHLAKDNFYGLVLWSALLLLISGSLGLRSAIHHHVTDLYIFVSVIMLEVVAFPCFIIFIIISYANHWVTKDAFPTSSIQFPVTAVAASVSAAGLALVVLAFIQYYEQVFCGDLQLCRKCVHFCAPCWCPRVVSQDQLYQDDRSRPPSLPV